MTSLFSRGYIRLFNAKVPIRDLLIELGYASDRSHSIYCPFHPDDQGGHKSAVILDKDNKLYCFSEVRVFTAWDVLNKLQTDPQKYLLNNIENSIKETGRAVQLSDTTRKKFLKGEITYLDLLNELESVLEESDYRRNLRKEILSYGP